MFEHTSRYIDIENTTVTREDGSIITYKKRRFIPLEEQPVLQEVIVTASDRLDLITARILGDPEQFWQICDANNTMHPLELMRVGKILKVSVPRR